MANLSKAKQEQQYQSCDRCRSKKIKCTYGKKSSKQCTNCKTAFLECRNDDKLLRRSSPRGYTELLEETCRNLEIEVQRMKELNTFIVNNSNITVKQNTNNGLKIQDVKTNEDLKSENETNNLETGFFKVAVKTEPASENIINPDSDSSLDPNHDSYSSKTEESNAYGSNVSTRKSSIIHSNNKSCVPLDIKDPPALTASKILKQNQDTPSMFNVVPLLVSLASPRSTTEVLFCTQLIAKVGLNFGFLNRECLYTSKLLSSLKDDFEGLEKEPYLEYDTKDTGKKISSNVDLNEINEFVSLFEYLFTIEDFESFAKDSKKFKNSNSLKLLTFDEIEHFIEVYFDKWSSIVPIFLKSEFFNTFHKFKADYLNYQKTMANNNSDQKTPNNYKIFMFKLLAIVQMGLLSENKSSHKIQYIIKKLVLNPYFTANNTSLSSLQFLTLSLHLIATTSPKEQTLYQLRSTTCMMVQQLRLQRCPQSIVNSNGQQSDIVHRRTRRLLYWSNHILDCMVSFQLGVPRLIKDEDCEVLLPFDEPLLGKEDSNVEIVGLEILKLGRILGGVLDGLFKKFNSSEKTIELKKQEFLLETWFVQLPEKLKFKMNPEGNVNREHLEDLLDSDYNLGYGVFNLVFVYFFCKSMIYLTLVSIGDNSNSEVNLSQAQNSPKDANSSQCIGEGIISQNKIPSYLKLYQYTEIMLQLISMSMRRGFKITIPMFIPNLSVIFSLLGLERALEYKKSCELFLQYRKLIEVIIEQMVNYKTMDASQNPFGTVGSLSWYTLKLFDITLSLLLIVNTKEAKETDEYFKKRVDHKVLKMIKRKAAFYENYIKNEVSYVSQGSLDNKKNVYHSGDDNYETVKLDKNIKYNEKNGVEISDNNSLNAGMKNFSIAGNSNLNSVLGSFGKKNSICKLEETGNSDDDDNDDDGGLEFKTVTMAKKMSTDGSNIKRESSEDIGSSSLDQYSMKWDGNVNTLTNVFQQDPVLSFGDLNQYFGPRMMSFKNLNQQSQNITAANSKNSSNKSTSISPNNHRDVSTVVNSNLAEIKYYPVNDLSSYPPSTNTLAVHDKKHKILENNLSDASILHKLGTSTEKSHSKQAVFNTNSGNNAENFDWTESGNLNTRKNIMPNMSLANMQIIDENKDNLLDSFFDNFDSKFLMNERGTHVSNQKNTKDSLMNSSLNIQGINIHQNGNNNTTTNIGQQNTGNILAPENSFIFDGSLGLAQFLDMNHLNENTKTNGMKPQKRSIEDISKTLDHEPYTKLFKHSK